MALASLGAFTAMLITAGLNARLQTDFAREWADSLRIKMHEPLGETAIMNMLGKGNGQAAEEDDRSERT